MSKSHLDYLYDELKKDQLDVKKEELNELIPFDYLKITMPSEMHEDLEYSLIMRVQSLDEVSFLVPIETPYHIVQIVYEFPDKVQKNHLADVSRLINLINKVAPLPGFGYDEVQNACYYKYCYFFKPNDHNTGTIIEFYFTILDLYHDLFVRVLSGKENVQNLLDDIQKRLAVE